MALRSDWSDELCPIRRSLDVVGDPWVMLIIRDVLHGPRRFDTLRDNLRVSDAVLARRLRGMVEAGLLVRVQEDAGDGRARHGYRATDAATELLPILQQLAIWGERYTQTPRAGGHMALIHTDCGQESSQGQVCSACGEVLTADRMIWDRSWRESSPRLDPSGILL